MDQNQGFTDKQKTELVQIVGEVVDSKLEQKLEQKLEEKLEEKFDKKLKPINSRLKKIEDLLHLTIRTFDRYYLNHEKRITNLESVIIK